MPDVITMASLASHIPVEIGDILHPPGFTAAGEVVELSHDEIGLRMPVEAPQGIMRTHPSAAGVVYMHTQYLRPRPEGVKVVNHGH